MSSSKYINMEFIKELVPTLDIETRQKIVNYAYSKVPESVSEYRHLDKSDINLELLSSKHIAHIVKLAESED